MSKPPVSIGCAVVLSPGMTGPPDAGVITTILQSTVTFNGMPLAVAGSLCQMINSLSGAPYMLPIGSLGVSTGFTVDGMGLVRMGDQIPSGPGILSILGPPANPMLLDGWPP